MTYDEQQAQIFAQVLAVLRKVRPADRRTLARLQLTQAMRELVEFFDRIPKPQLAKTVLFVSVQPHMREARLAAAAKLAGWDPVLLHFGATKYPRERYFRYFAQFNDLAMLALATWLFPGALQHIFVLRGDHAQVLCALKNSRTVLDIYDTGSGMKSVPLILRGLERDAIRLADGITHRDLRIRYLEKLYGYTLPKHNVLIHDPAGEALARPARRDGDREIRVVSTGWIGSGDSSAVRIAQALCRGGVHLHVYFNPNQKPDDPTLKEYAALAAESPYFHIEPQVFGEAYWEHLLRYDFGLSINERDVFGEPYADYTADYIAGCGSSRLMDYVQAGLGVIHSPGLKFQSLLARHYAPALVPADVAFLKSPYATLEAALTRRRTKSLQSIQLPAAAKRLGEFYGRVCGQK
jgi:hypothetical protein